MSSPIAYQEIYKAGFEDFIVPTYEVAPFTTIQNRAMVTRSLKAIAGNERIPVTGINLLSNEFGPNGERIYEIQNKDSRVRLGGVWDIVSYGSGTGEGTSLRSSSIGSFIEIAFFGTGVGLLMDTVSTTKDLRASVDGGAEGANLNTVTWSTIFGNRGYNTNQQLAVVSGLSLGWHTVKIRVAVATLNYCYGFEILNERTDLAVYSGAGISNGSIQGLSALATSPFNAGVVGTRGARIVKYIQNGVISQAVQEVDATSKYLTLADHTNEEVVRRINFREFGCNRADDFSTLGASTTERAFTLDDGSTTLVGGSVWADVNGMIMGNIVNGFTTITFTGTGLDITSLTNGSPGDTITVYVDGVSIGTLPPAVTLLVPLTIKVCSGLPYGSHSVKFRNTTDLSDRYVQDFIIYQPKTPSVPAGALAAAPYNLMANFVPNTSIGTLATGLTSSTGILRKMNIREMTYVGTFAFGAINNNFPSGYAETTSNPLNSYIEYTFWGTGYDQRFLEQTARAALVNVTLNGLALNTTNFPTALTANTGNGVSMNLATGVLDMQAASTIGIGGVCVYNLPLAKYTLRFTKGDALATVLEVACLDIITPIHHQDSSLKIGSQSLKSVTKFSPEKSVSNAGPDLSKAKAWIVYNTLTQTILSSYNVSAALRISAGLVNVYFEKPFKNSNYTAIGMGTNWHTALNSLKNANYAAIVSANAAHTATDDLQTSVMFFGELIDE
jgi:hypothetical protein